ncbi:MAG: heme biosynthesis HemY N-terminal domain-containing protein [Halieaceae bacterium]|jgi:HemY protein|nr:heme biosynthesis HemY N-terminal domain-containing protein [Halieaceae bacterium]
MGSLFLVAVLALLAGVGIVALIETEPGYLLIAYGGYTVETSFWVGIVLISTVVLLLYTFLRFLHGLASSPGSMLSWAGARRLRQSARLTNRGLISFVEGHYGRARKQLMRGARYSAAPLRNYLLAARASERLQEPEEMRRYLALAADCDPDAAVAVELTQAELLIQMRQYEQALASLERSRANPGRYPQALQLLSRIYDGLGDIESMAALIPELRRHRIGGPVELDDLEARVYADLLEKAAVTGDVARLQALWKRYPVRLSDNPAVQIDYLEALLDCEQTALVEKEIVRRLKKQWEPALVDLYGRIPRESASKPLATAEGWLKRHGEDPTLLLCLGRLAMVEREWSRARDYLERSHAKRPSEEVCLELGRLLTAVGEHAAAAAVFRAGTELRSSPLPKLPQPDDVVPETHRLAEDQPEPPRPE